MVPNVLTRQLPSLKPTTITLRHANKLRHGVDRAVEGATRILPTGDEDSTVHGVPLFKTSLTKPNLLQNLLLNRPGKMLESPIGQFLCQRCRLAPELPRLLPSIDHVVVVGFHHS